jgi:hypothetical protein
MIMKRPKQLPAVDRNTVTKSAAVPAGANVNPSGWFDDVVSTIGKVGQVAGTVAPLLGAF